MAYDGKEDHTAAEEEGNRREAAEWGRVRQLEQQASAGTDNGDFDGRVVDAESDPDAGNDLVKEVTPMERVTGREAMTPTATTDLNLVTTMTPAAVRHAIIHPVDYLSMLVLPTSGG
jgi:hypothetical protein